MNNFNLYLDELVDQGYDMTLTMYFIKNYIHNYKYNYENFDNDSYGCGCIYQYGCQNGYGYWQDQYGYAFR